MRSPCSLRIDGAALEWTALTVAFAALPCGLVPALRMAGGQLSEALKDTSAGAGQGRSHHRIRSLVVVSEVALSCMLLVGAGLLLRSFVNVLNVDLGFEPGRAAAIMVDYDDGVTAAGMVDYLPMAQNREWGAPIPKGFKLSRQRVKSRPQRLMPIAWKEPGVTT